MYTATFRLFKPEIDEIKEFVEEHQTIVACAATAVIAVILTRKVDIRIAKKFAYEVGREAGAMHVQNALLRKFVFEKGLKEEFLHEFIPSLT